MSGKTVNVRPFPNGTEGYDWLEANCGRCQLNGYKRDETPCPMEKVVSHGFVIGTVPAALAAEYGATVRGEYCDMPRQCAHFVPPARCEFVSWSGARRLTRCERATADVWVEDGLRHAVCEKHARWLAKRWVR